MRIKYIGCLLVVAGFAIGSAQANLWTAHPDYETHFVENFDRSGGDDLHGLEPHITTNGATWDVGAAFNLKADGSFGSTAGRSALLAFVPETGRIYRMDLSFNEKNDVNDWTGFGFGTDGTRSGTNQAVPHNEFNSGRATAWMIVRGPSESTDAGETLIRVSTGGGGSASVTSEHNALRDKMNEDGGIDIRMELDTRPSDWTVTFFTKAIVDSDWIELRSGTLEYENIAYVGMTSRSGANGEFASFSFSSIPEPGTMGMLLAGMMGLLALRRRLRS